MINAEVSKMLIITFISERDRFKVEKIRMPPTPRTAMEEPSI